MEKKSNAVWLLLVQLSEPTFQSSFPSAGWAMEDPNKLEVSFIHSTAVLPTH